VHLGLRAQGRQAQGDRPHGGPLAPDSPIARGYNDAAKAFAAVDDNPIISWAYRVWCVTGYRTTGEAGTGQAVDELADPATDLMTPKGFLLQSSAKPMPAGGIQFMDNAWYFGNDITGSIVVKAPEGLLVFDTLSNPEQFETQVVAEMTKAGLDPTAIKYVFMGHQHGDHVGGANLIRRKYAPGAVFVMGQPDAQGVADARKRLLSGEPETGRGRGGRGGGQDSGGRGAQPAVPPNAQEAEARKQARLMALPDRVDIQVAAFAGMTNGMQRIKIGDKTEVVAALVPGHTVGQLAAIVPVVYKGEPHKLVVWSGNDNIDNSVQYATSLDFFRSLAYIEGADAQLNTHAYQGDAFKLLRQFKANPSMANPIILGKDGVQRYLGIWAECSRALARRVLDGTWKRM
jgi:glyoxylase-like metal-dependent hydrolase (beta-lactamase superfamily II)